MNDILKQIELLGIVPVVKLDDAKDALPLAKALIDGGLPVAEITFRTNAAESAIRQITEAYPQMLVGAGTVLTIDQIERAIDAGAKFIVTPGFNREIVEYCVERDIPITPGCPTTSDIEAALSLGLDVVKFFPAENLGGIKMIKALAAPYVGVRFMPTGGINTGNLNDYLTCDKVLACGGSWMVKDSLITAGKFDEIERITREAVLKMLDFRFDHIGIHSPDDAGAAKTAAMFAKAFGFPNDDAPVSIWATPEIEVMKNSIKGTRGHLAVHTNSIPRAIRYLTSVGVEMDESSALYNEKGEVRLIYLKEEFGEFALHLC